MNVLAEVSDENHPFVKSETLSLPTEDEGLVPDSVKIYATAIGEKVILNLLLRITWS